MGVARPDALEVLLSEVPPPTWRRAQAWTTFLRLFSEDARPERASPVAVNLDRARSELERHALERLAGALNELLREHLEVALGPLSFVWLGAERAALGAAQGSAWSALEERRGELPWLAQVPAPGEPALDVAERLIESLARLGADELRVGLWRARARRAALGPAEGERAFEELYRARGADAVLRRRALAGWIECLLDRGAVGRAAAALEDGRGAGLAAGDRRLAQLAIWVALFAGQAGEARALAERAGPWAGRVPAAVVELRAERPDWLALLAGSAPAPGPLPVREAAPERSRRAVGALAFVVVAFEPGRGLRRVHADVAPALAARLEDWWAERENAYLHASELEHRAIVTARSVVVHRSAQAALPGALDPSARALALEPVLDAEGEVAGWLRMEFAHHLVPAAAERRELARGWRVALAAAGRAHSSAGSSEEWQREWHEARDAVVRRAFEGFVATLGIKTALRHWWGLVLEENGPRTCAEGGRPLEGELAGRARALARARSTRGAVIFDEPDASLALHASSASGAVLPVVDGAELFGFLAIESARRRDFRPADGERLAAAARSFGRALRVARFRDWHRARFGFDVVLEAGASRFGRRVHDFVAAGRSSASIALTGARGTGKEIIARWLHFESAHRDAPIACVRCARPDALARLRELAAEERGGTLICDDVAALEPAAQALVAGELARPWGDRAAGGPRAPRWRVIATLCEPLGAARASGRLLPELAEPLQRLELFVPPLAERREELPELARVLALRFAAEENLAPIELPDGALALLWRQPWPGNVRDLENLIFKLTLLAPGSALEPADIQDVARRFGLELVRRLPSRHPNREELLAALRTTRTARGTANKTRAALYLGWDPDTLVARLRDAGLGEHPDLDAPFEAAPETADEA